MTLRRLSGLWSSKNAVTLSAVGMRPMMSSETRRRNSASVVRADTGVWFSASTRLTSLSIAPAIAIGLRAAAPGANLAFSFACGGAAGLSASIKQPSPTNAATPTIPRFVRMTVSLVCSSWADETRAERCSIPLGSIAAKLETLPLGFLPLMHLFEFFEGEETILIGIELVEQL